MTTPRGRARRRPPGTAAPRWRASQALVLLAVLAVFVTGLVVGGTIGAVIIAVLSVASGAWLWVRWDALDRRVKYFRAGVVIVGLAVAASLLFR